MTSSPLFLVADIGGTNTRAALCDGTTLRAASVTRFRNTDFATLEAVLARYVAEQGSPDLAGTCIALAGPVTQEDGVTRGRMTNLSWHIDTEALRRVTGAPEAAILNDLQAQAYALPYLPAAETQTLFGPPPQEGATQLVLGVGTGFNAAVSIVSGGRKRVVPASESGHIGLPVGSDIEWALSKYVAGHHGFAAVEDILSGRGLERVHAFVTRDTAAMAAQSAAEIAQSASHVPAAREAMHLFSRVLGRVAGDLSLVHLPTGGIYLVGGVSRAIAPYFVAGGGAETFRDKGRFGAFMDQFTMHLVCDDFAALIGCAGRLIDEDKKTNVR